MNKLQRRQEGIKRARRLLRVWRARVSKPLPSFYDYDGEAEKQLRKTRTPCSCYMCGNPRKHYGELTVQEKKSLLDRDFCFIMKV